MYYCNNWKLITVIIFMVFGLYILKFSNDLQWTFRKSSRSLLDGFKSMTVEELLRDSVYSDISLNELDLDTLKFLLHGILTSKNVVCKNYTLYGRTTADGGYEVCTSGNLAPDPKSCTVLSIGINNEWSFDEGMAGYGCYVHSFDPSLKLKDHMHKPTIQFHNLGLAKKNSVSKQGWPMKNIMTILRDLRLDDKVIDVIKCDAEGAEWSFLEDVITNLIKVKQIILEIHSPKLKPQVMTREDFIYLVKLFVLLNRNGFVISHSYHKYVCCDAFAPMMPDELPEKCCHEVYMYNSSGNAIVKMLSHGGTYEFLISDHKRLWSEIIAENDLMSRFESLNHGMEMEAKEFHKMFNEVTTEENKESKFTMETSNEFNNLKFEIAFKVSNLNIEWFFLCRLATPESFCRHVTEPLLKSLSYLLVERETVEKLFSQREATLERYRQQDPGKSMKRKPGTGPTDLSSLKETILSGKEFEKTLAEGFGNIYREPFQSLMMSVVEKSKDLYTVCAPIQECTREMPSTAYGIAQKNLDENEIDQQETKKSEMALSNSKTEEDVEIKRRKILENKLAEEAKKLSKKKKVIKF